VVPWGTLATAALGLAGIIGTAWQGKRSREAQSVDLRASIDAAAENLRLSITTEDDRANKAEKRRIYARHLAACADVWMTRAKWDTAIAIDSAALISEYVSGVATMVAAASEVRLIAPDEVGRLAYKITAAMPSYVRATSAPDSFDELREQLIAAMRADLGEPVPDEIQPRANVG
jgi:hypothetical protein